MQSFTASWTCCGIIFPPRLKSFCGAPFEHLNVTVEDPTVCFTVEMVRDHTEGLTPCQWTAAHGVPSFPSSPH